MKCTLRGFSQWDAPVPEPDRATKKAENGLRWLHFWQAITVNLGILVAPARNRLHKQREVPPLCGRLCQTPSREGLDVERPEAGETYGHGVDDATRTTEKTLAESLGRV
jgi:hypothetical protein